MGKIYSTKARADGRADSDESFSYTPSQALELQRCHDDPQYFVDNYLLLQTPMFGSIAFQTRDYQQTQLDQMKTNSLICLQPRQSGATSIPLAFQLWEAIFRSNTQHGAAFVKNQASMDGMGLIRFWYDKLPTWLRPDITYYNKHTIEFDNGSRIVCGQINRTFSKGRSWSTLFADNLAYASDNDQQDFWYSTVPSVAGSGRIFLTGTPNGPTNTFANIWNHVSQSLNTHFTPMHVQATDVYDSLSLDRILHMIGLRAFRTEYQCEFIP